MANFLEKMYGPARRFERKGSAPGDDYVVSEKIDKFLYFLHIHSFHILIASYIYHWIWERWQLVTLFAYIPLWLQWIQRPSQLLIWQTALFFYVTIDWAVTGNSAGTFVVVILIWYFITFTALLVKRLWYGLDMQHC